MRIEHIWLRSAAAHVPGRRLLSDALARGECSPAAVAQTDVESVAISASESAAELAVHAARSALTLAGSEPDDIDLILHADTYHQGQDLWPVGSYIQRETVGNGCLALEIRQMSNGGLAAMDLAVAYLGAGGSRRDALLTSADRFCRPGIDRWQTDPGTPYGDGAGAVVLSTRGGVARLRSLSVFADSALEPLHRGDEPFGDAPFAHRMPVDFAAAKHAFVRDHGLAYAISHAAAGQTKVIEEALSDAGVTLAEVDWVVLPHFGRRRLETIYTRPMGIELDQTAWAWSRTVGHLGAADQFAGLGYLLNGDRVRAGHRILLVSVGAGYSWGAAVLEIETDPQAWAAREDRAA